MAQTTVKPLDLTVDEKKTIKEYLKSFNEWDNYKYEDDIFDAFKRAEYLCECDSMKRHFTALYAKIPQIVKDEYLVPRPEYPHSPRVVKRSPSCSRVIEVIW